ncbi:unnamed protein product [Sphenostylis stenocarpa]|uniref:3-ketodihydrosphingosine reductase n=1 Tax=Sphenostylis stenocarpa TaxID=92480 RepID=A0AA86SMQ1_9FABA|nr:unnamed protein product [Sphenostylis stenocarpa]
MPSRLLPLHLGLLLPTIVSISLSPCVAMYPCNCMSLRSCVTKSDYDVVSLGMSLFYFLLDLLVAVFSTDVRDFEAVKRAVDEAGPIDVLLLNHGVFVGLELEKMELSEVKFTLDVNLMGTLNFIKAALPAMKNRKDPLPASIALVSSQAGQKAFDGIKCGSFIVSCNLEGIALSIATAGLSPQRSFLMAFVEVIAAGILRIVALGMHWSWYGSIEKYHSQREGFIPK